MTADIDPTKCFTVQEVADRLNLSARTVERLMKDGTLPSRRVSPRRRVITERDLAAYLND